MENGRLSRFVYHQGELLYERSEDKEVSCHLGGGTEAAQVRSEQYYLRARYYNPVVGRFLQEDVYEGDGLNLYAYCGNNPVRYYDPGGYVSIDIYMNQGSFR